MRAIRATLEFRVGLSCHPERMVRQLNELDEATIGRHSATDEASLFQTRTVGGVELVAMAVSLAHYWLAIRFMHFRTWG